MPRVLFLVPPTSASAAPLRNRRRRLPPDLLPLAEVAAQLGIGLSTAERLKAAGNIVPPPVTLAGLKWRRRELLAWLAHPGPDGQLLTVAELLPVWRQLAADRDRRR